MTSGSFAILSSRVIESLNNNIWGGEEGAILNFCQTKAPSSPRMYYAY